MPKYNDMFELSVEDMELIEMALRGSFESLSRQDAGGPAGTADDLDRQLRRIHDLLGRLHNQKIFYRPRDDTYVGG